MNLKVDPYLLKHISLIKIGNFKERKNIYLEYILSGTGTGGT